MRTTMIAIATSVFATTAEVAVEPLTAVEGAHFFEGFQSDSWEERWKVSKDAEFTGTWKHSLYQSPEGISGDKGIEVGDAAKKHALSTVFSESFDPKGQGLVVQYELHISKKNIECGCAYIKLLTATDALSHDGFTNASPYTIMFGPDKCGSTNKVHFILRHKSPKTGEWEEKHLASTPYPSLSAGQTHLYTAIVATDNSVKILVDNKESKSVSLLKDGDFKPNVNPPKEIDDPEDTKPSDWVDQAKIDEPGATKPEDWDEDAPAEIVDSDATKPAEWLDDGPAQVPDPESAKPDDWDEDEDGAWEVPLVDNPACKPPGGCGEWKPPKIPNPAYKGKWFAPKIDNPEYKGVWAPAKIANPDYFEDAQPHAMAPIGGIGIELWTMQEGALFDNILVTSDPAVAAEAAKAFEAREEGVKAAKAAEAAKAKEEESDGKEEEPTKKDEL